MSPCHCQGNTPAQGSAREDAVHPEEDRMRPAFLRLSLPLSPWMKRMAGPQAQGLSVHALVGTGAQHARGMMEGGFRRWLHGAEHANLRLCTARRWVQSGCAHSRYNSCTKSGVCTSQADGGRLVPASAAQSLAPGMQGGESDTYSRGCPSSSSRKY